ncbi:hypothetical protein WJX72_010449 [[Myrmecia] bisecta]|uniref:Uncharacterized protein n=1 Tax=[Myrmecia] bisecta TaxID=41462 RepID=A0AAW1PTM1_9CHLO
MHAGLRQQRHPAPAKCVECAARLVPGSCNLAAGAGQFVGWLLWSVCMLLVAVCSFKVEVGELQVCPLNGTFIVLAGAAEAVPGQSLPWRQTGEGEYTGVVDRRVAVGG